MAAQLKQKTQNVLDMGVDGYHIVCVVNHEQAVNPYHLYVKWYDGTSHMKQVARYQNFVSVIEHIRTWMHNNHIGFKDVF